MCKDGRPRVIQRQILIQPLEYVCQRHFPPRHHIAAVEHVAFGENTNIVGGAVHRCGALVGVNHNDHLRPRPQPVGHFFFYSRCSDHLAK